MRADITARLSVITPHKPAKDNPLNHHKKVKTPVA
jgi:hypothetical protein